MKRRSFLGFLGGATVVAVAGKSEVVRVDLDATDNANNLGRVHEADEPGIIIGEDGKRYRLAPLKRPTVDGGQMTMLGTEECLDLIEVEEIPGLGGYSS